MNQFSVTVLGSSSAIPTSSRFPSAQVVAHNHQLFLVDCGEGTQIQLRKNQIRFSKINHIFISHLHGDHFFGLIGLISTFNLLGRKTELHIYAEDKIKQVLEMQLEVSGTVLNFAISYHSLLYDGLVMLYEDKHLEVYSFPLVHSVPTCGFLFKEKPNPRKIKKEMLDKYSIPDSFFALLKQGEDFVTDSGERIPNDFLTTAGKASRSYAYCSDTAYAEYLTAYILGVDLLYHETSFMEDMRKVAEEKKHATTLDAGRIANLVQAKKMIIGHFSARYKEPELLLNETRGVFPNTQLAVEGCKIDV